MIKINLLPEQKRAKVANVEKEVVLFLLVLGLLGCGMFFAQNWISTRIDSLRTANSQKNEQKISLLKKIGTINTLEKKSKEAGQYIEVIKDIRSRQTRPVRFLDELVSNLPRGQIWFESMEMEKDGQLEVTGVALDNQVFAGYVKKLRSSAVISNVILHQTSRKKIREYNLVAFRCRIESGKHADKGQDG
ncbi:MAG: PilN domain-containing protein [Desulfohalobiaceae bacterium]|nr:PilN domain-containing protein [Desulfohalobiaceae bacterium]